MAMDEQLTESFFSMEQMKTEWGAKERDYCHQLERYRFLHPTRGVRDLICRDSCSNSAELKDRLAYTSRLEQERSSLQSELNELQQLR